MHAVTYLPSQFRWTPQQLIDAMSRDLADWSETIGPRAVDPYSSEDTTSCCPDHDLALRSYQPERPRFALFRLR